MWHACMLHAPPPTSLLPVSLYPTLPPTLPSPLSPPILFSPFPPPLPHCTPYPPCLQLPATFATPATIPEFTSFYARSASSFRTGDGARALLRSARRYARRTSMAAWRRRNPTRRAKPESMDVGGFILSYGTGFWRGRTVTGRRAGVRRR